MDLKNIASNIRSFGAAAASSARAAASDAAAAARDVRKAALGGSPSQAIVGTVVTVARRAFYIESHLADGGFGSVYLVSIAEDGGGGGAGNGRKFVLKKMYAGSPELGRQLTAEVSLMQSLQDHAGIVRVLSSETRPSGREGAEILVIMEFCPGGHMLMRINSMQAAKSTLPFHKILDLFSQIVRPVVHMHTRNPPVAHRDLKVRFSRSSKPSSVVACWLTPPLPLPCPFFSF